MACQSKETQDSTSAWLPNQVRALDPIESTAYSNFGIRPNQDLIALYTRQTTNDLQIRLDLLELELESKFEIPLDLKFDLYLEFDFTPDDTNFDWDIQVQVPAEGNPAIVWPDSQSSISAIPRVYYDLKLDSITVSIGLDSLPNLYPNYSLQAYITTPGTTQRLDEIPIVSSTDTIEPTPLLIAFWNSMPGHTPAQALRRWDGAHTGPFGERHGLKHLLDASQKNQVPITLLDLKTPASLTSLDALNQTERISELITQGLLLIPDTLPEAYFGNLASWVAARASETSRQTGVVFELPGNNFLFTPSPPEKIPASYQLTFFRESSETDNSLPLMRLSLWQGQPVLALPMARNPQSQVTEQGLTLEMRRALLEQAFDQDHTTDIALLGGDLPTSPWGDPQAARSSLHYLSGHPWINVLNATELASLLACENKECPELSTKTNTSFEHPAVAALQNSPSNPISELAWQMFLDLSAPATPVIRQLGELRAQYLGEIGNLLAAAKWENTRRTSNMAMRNIIKQDCTNDTDFDGKPECTLSNGDLFALLDPDGGRLVLLFSRTPEGVTQLIGPSSQFIIGLSDYREWDLSAGPLADPANIPGAFAGPWSDYHIEDLDDGLRFLSQGAEKTFRFTENGLKVEIKTDEVHRYQIPLAVAPQTRFTPGWVEKFEETEIPQGWVWGIKAGPKVEIRSSGDLTNQNFLESKIQLENPENPNLDYPSGHFLPYPLAILYTPASSEFWVEIIPIEDLQPDQ
jgi:hypothetical protein